MQRKFPDYKIMCIDDLIPYAMNSRMHSEKQINKLAASIKEFGFINPVVIDGENGIVAGHGRVMAAKAAGLKEIPVISACHLTEQQKRAYVIADNRIALESSWNDEVLALELSDIGESGFDIDLIGFDEKEISKLFDETKGISISDELCEQDEKSQIIIKFDSKNQADIINALSKAIAEFYDATIWVDDEQV